MIFTNSSISTFKSCERRYAYKYVHQLNPQRESKALSMGSMFHLGLDVLLKPEPVGAGSSPDLDPTHTTLPADPRSRLLLALQAVYQAYQDRPSGVEPTDWAVQRETVMALLAGWYGYWQSEMEMTQVLESELKFKIRVKKGSRDWLMGKIDRIVEKINPEFNTYDPVERDPYNILVMEHKTTSEKIESGSDYLMKLAIDPQISTYFHAATELGYPVQGIIYDITRKPTIRPKNVTKADAKVLGSTGKYYGLECEVLNAREESPEMFGARLLSDISERPDFYYSRVTVARTHQQISQWQGDTNATISRIHLANRLKRFIANEQACLYPGRCAFADLCFSGYRPETLDPREAPNGFKRTVLHPELE